MDCLNLHAFTSLLIPLLPVASLPHSPEPAAVAFSRERRHLRAALLAVGLVLLSGVAAGVFTLRLEKREIHTVALEGSPHKDLSIVWQRAAMAEPDILPLYGSSELAKHFGNEPQRFFAGYPTGFAVSPVGRGGCTSLVLAEKIAAAAGDAPHGRKLAVSLSPSWFFHMEAHHRWYVGNFSAAQASVLIFSPRLSLELKRDFARRMLDYPDSVEHAPVLAFALHRLVGRQWADTALYHAVTPLARVQDALGRLGDHFAFAWHILHDHDRPDVSPRPPSPLDWETILTSGRGEVVAQPKDRMKDYAPRFVGNRRFVQVLGESREWDDLELLLRVMHELDLDPLLLSIPVDYPYYESIGITRASLDQYLAHLHALASRYDVTLVDFAAHENDTAFFADHNDHLSARGWLYMDRALDFYYHASAHQRFIAPDGIGAGEIYP
ncbi:MAG: D-alanyl-lipoteichoic acid biosynthesis protein DltD [Chthoniobacter sp.]|uniref:D-alanyl-lipoteichoic acid biosynthesis protein DltD n=1 Tax=Chthoniobacter sp. TaxID=2510640 RepID=UPI0032A80944